ncbi:soluble quino protein glucose dehydrogenase [Xylariomycetidae sp. FL0641]|nr:soluble quino protein glucose dehydrogenase [Xylariomycetidae sp. FL0641]
MGLLSFKNALAIGQVGSASQRRETTASCPQVPAPLHPYNLAPGWKAVKVADGLHSPRDLVIDAAGRLLIVEEGVGVSQHTVDGNGCITSSRMLVSDSALNHGIYFSPDGHTLYASSTPSVFRWSYDPSSGNIGSGPTTVVTGMDTSGHNTRTLIISKASPDLLVVAHGSNANLDYASVDPKISRAIVKVFDMASVPTGGYNYAAAGWDAGHGLRNEVGLAFDENHMLWGVENSADEIERTVNGGMTDVHNNNPAEELNFLGNVSEPNNDWYGYPACFTVWDPSLFKDRTFKTGDQFTPAPNGTFDDDSCARLSVPPRLSLQAHSAPLSCKFDAGFINLFVTMHGSWNRQPPVGYKVVAVPFTRNLEDGNFAPNVDADSPEGGVIDVFYPPNESQCSSSTCIRPVGLVFDGKGRMYVTSDSSGELFLLSGF